MKMHDIDASDLFTSYFILCHFQKAHNVLSCDISPVAFLFNFRFSFMISGNGDSPDMSKNQPSPSHPLYPNLPSSTPAPYTHQHPSPYPVQRTPPSVPAYAIPAATVSLPVNNIFMLLTILSPKHIIVPRAKL